MPNDEIARLHAEIDDLKKAIANLKYNEDTLFRWVAHLARADIDVLIHGMAGDLKVDAEDRKKIRDTLFESYKIAKSHEEKWGGKDG